jgi:hypothetical protein
VEVGFLVGRRDGFGVGFPGKILGSEEGVTVGAEGALLGIAEGRADGQELVGKDEGEPEGCVEGGWEVGGFVDG